MKTTAAPHNWFYPGWICFITLGTIIAFLFRGSFIPGQLAFANDAPFGLMDAFSEHRWSHFWRGSWGQANWVGTEVLPLQPSFTHLWFLIGGSTFFNKFIAPISLFFFGFSAYLFGKSQRFSPWVSGLMGVAAMLNGNILSHACWGLGGRAVYLGFFLLAASSLGRPTHGGSSWLRTLPAGLCIGLVIVEGADTGAIQAVCFAIFFLVHQLIFGRNKKLTLFTAPAKLMLVVVMSTMVAALALTGLVGTQIQGIAGTAQDEATRQKRWDFATAWSFPPTEVSRIAVAGIKGYRMDTPDGGNYWGDVGSDASPPRFSGGGEYAGVIVLLFVGWVIACSIAQDKNTPFDRHERRLIWFWALIAFSSILFAFGHFAPFYKFIYQLPYFSTIRIPMKFLHLMHVSFIILFGYGLEGIRRRYFIGKSPCPGGLNDQIQAWWSKSSGFDQNWRLCMIVIAVGVITIAVVYEFRTPNLTKIISRASGINIAEAPSMAAFSAREVWIATGFLLTGLAILTAIVSGHFAGREMKAFSILGLILTVDLYRASTPWIQHYDFERRYQSNPVIDMLKVDPYEGRVTARISPRLRSGFTSINDFTFPALQNQWLEHHFQKFRIQTLDIIQMSRVPQLDEDFLKTFEPTNQVLAQLVSYALEIPNLALEPASQVRNLLDSTRSKDFPKTRRLWELTNTRFIIGSKGTAMLLNAKFDSEQKRFQTRLEFALTLKPDMPRDRSPGLDDITAIAMPGGPYEVVEFTGALPRTKVFNRWQIETNTHNALTRLADLSFDPQSELLLSDHIDITPTASSTTTGTATIKSWLPRDLVIHCQSSQPGVLLIVQKWHRDWKATLDGQPIPILKANHLFTGVQLPVGEHIVELHYEPSRLSLYVTLLALVVGFAGLLLIKQHESADSNL